MDSFKVFVSVLKSALKEDASVIPLLQKEKWEQLYRDFTSHAIVGLLYQAIANAPKEKRPDGGYILKLYGHIRLLEQLNKKLDGLTLRVYEGLKAQGCAPLILKGQTVACHYKYPQWRSPGDVDVLTRSEYRLSTSWFHDNAKLLPSHDLYKDKHEEYSIDGIIVENHFRLSKLYHPRLNRQLQQIFAQEVFEARLSSQNVKLMGGEIVETLSPTINILYLFIHYLCHFVSEGIGFRQTCDIIMFMNAFHDKIDRVKLDSWIDFLELRPLTNAFATFMTDALEYSPHLIPYTWKRTPKQSRRFFEHIFKVGNYGSNLRSDDQQTAYQYYIWKSKTQLSRSFLIMQFAPKELLSANVVKLQRLCKSVYAALVHKNRV